MAGKDVAASSARGLRQPKSAARRLWRVARAVLYVLRRPAGRKLAVGVGLLLRRGKAAGGRVLALGFSNHGGSQQSGFSSSSARSSSSFSSCRRSFDVHEPSARRGSSTRRDREVEFSCSNTPFSAERRGRHCSTNEACFSYDHGIGYDAAEIAKVFEILSLDEEEDDDALALAVATTPSPAQQVDREADEFIRRFYEQLRAQKSAAATPDIYGRSPRPVAAGIA